MRKKPRSAYLMHNRSTDAEFTDYVVDLHPDFVAVTETWFKDDEPASRVLCTPIGYKLLDCPRLNRNTGGTVIFFRDCIKVSRVIAIQVQSFEYSIWTLKIGSTYVRLLIVYRLQYSNVNAVSINEFFAEFKRTFSVTYSFPKSSY